MNDRYLPGSIAIAVAVLAIIAMAISWRRRSRRDAALSPLTELPAALGAELASISGFYVATTVHRKAWERLAVRGLGFRSRVVVGVHEAGLVLAIPAQREIFIPAGSIEEAVAATWAIDRVVERDGLVLVAWRLTSGATPSAAAPSDGSDEGTSADSTIVDSYFRIVDQQDRLRFFDAIHRIAPGAGAQTPAESEV
jgi:hypothetical protein